MPSPCHASLCLRQALLLKATPSLPASVHRRCMPRLCFAVAPRRTALRHRSCSAAGPGRATQCLCVSVRCRSFAEPFVSLPILRQSPLCCAVAFAPHCLALPSPRPASQCLSFADLGSAVHFHRLTEQIKAFPSPSLATHFLRSSRLSRASPSPGCATPCSSLPSPT